MADRKGLSLVLIQRNQGHPQFEWLAAISSDQTITGPVRQRVLHLACEWKP